MAVGGIQSAVPGSLRFWMATRVLDAAAVDTVVEGQEQDSEVYRTKRSAFVCTRAQIT